MRFPLMFVALLLCLPFLRAEDDPVKKAAMSKPNIVFILADDLGFGDLSCQGQKFFTTSRIDSLATDGIRFLQHYAGSTVCAPSRCALMTGYHTGHGFIRGNRPSPDGFGDYPLASGITTVADILKRNGYATGCFGKWGLGNNVNEGAPLKRGFDEFFGYYGQRDAHNYYPPYLHHNDEKIELDGKTYSATLIEEKALAFIRANRAKPFFCYMPVTIPHAAMQVPEEYVAPWRLKFPEFEQTIGKYSFMTEVRNPVAAFAGMVSKLDETVGRVLDLLNELGIDENTIVIFSSDNGPHKEGGHRPDLFHSSGPYRGLKRDLSEGGIHNPFLVRWPKRIKAGSETGHIAAFWDFLPTVCDIVGEEPPKGIDGISYLPTLLGDTASQKKHAYLYWEFHEQGGKRAIRRGDWKAIQLQVNTAPNGPIALYDLGMDIAEENDLAGQYPEKVEEFRKIFAEARTASDIFRFENVKKKK